MKKKLSFFDKCSCFVYLRRKNEQKKFPSVCLDVWLYVRTWTFAVVTITFEGLSGSKQNLVGVFYVWNVGLVLKSKVKSWSWSWSSSKTGFLFWKKLCGTTSNLVGIFKTQSVTFVIDFASGILILILKKKSEKMLWNKTEFHEHHQHVKHNFVINDYQKWYLHSYPDRNLTESKNWLKLIHWKLFNSIITHSLGEYSHETSTHGSDLWKCTNKSFCYLTLCKSSWKVSVIFLISTICLINHNN